MANTGGNFRFTGNPKVVQYQPRGLEYFTYLPQLKAQVRAAALQKANAQLMDSTGVAPQDLGKIQEITGYISSQTNSIVDKLMSNEAVDDSIVANLTGLSRQKMDADDKIKNALFNAKKRMDFQESMLELAKRSGDFEFSNALIKKADRDWGGTFKEDGTINDFAPVTRDHVPIREEILEHMKTAAGALKMKDKTTWNNMQFDVQSEPDPKTGKIVTVVRTNIPKDRLDNSDALRDAVKYIEDQINDKKSRWGSYMDFMDTNATPEYSKTLLNSLNKMSGAFFREEYMAPSSDVRVSVDNPIPATSGGTPAGTDFLTGERIQKTEMSNSQIPIRSYTPFQGNTTASDVASTLKDIPYSDQATMTKPTPSNLMQYGKEAAGVFNYFFGKTTMTADKVKEFLNAESTENYDNPAWREFKDKMGTREAWDVTSALQELHKTIEQYGTVNYYGQKELGLVPNMMEYEKARNKATKHNATDKEKKDFERMKAIVKASDNMLTAFRDYNSEVMSDQSNLVRNMQVYDVDWQTRYFSNDDQLQKTQDEWNENIKDKVIGDVRNGGRRVAKVTVKNGKTIIESSTSLTDEDKRTTLFMDAFKALDKPATSAQIAAKGEVRSLFEDNGYATAEGKGFEEFANKMDQAIFVPGETSDTWYLIENKETNLQKHSFPGTVNGESTNIKNTVGRLGKGETTVFKAVLGDNTEKDVVLSYKEGRIEVTVDGMLLTAPYKTKAAAIEDIDNILLAVDKKLASEK